jgi:hypothetical protein
MAGKGQVQDDGAMGAQSTIRPRQNAPRIITLASSRPSAPW